MASGVAEGHAGGGAECERRGGACGDHRGFAAARVWRCIRRRPSAIPPGAPCFCRLHDGRLHGGGMTEAVSEVYVPAALMILGTPSLA